MNNESFMRFMIAFTAVGCIHLGFVISDFGFTLEWSMQIDAKHFVHIHSLVGTRVHSLALALPGAKFKARFECDDNQKKKTTRTRTRRSSRSRSRRRRRSRNEKQWKFSAPATTPSFLSYQYQSKYPSKGKFYLYDRGREKGREKKKEMNREREGTSRPEAGSVWVWWMKSCCAL